MNKKQIKQRLSRAVSDSTPDVLDNILLKCEQQKGVESNMYAQENGASLTQSFGYEKRRTPARKKIWVRTAFAAAMMLVLAVFAQLGYSYFAVDSVIGIDVNPSIEIRTSRTERVLSVVPLNDDAVIVLDGMNLKNVDLDVAVNALIGSMLKHGYVSEIKNSILITVGNSDSKRGAELQARLSDEVNTFLNANSFDGAVMSQTLSEDKRLRALADEHNISIGKAAVVELVINQDPRLKFEDIAKLGINEINLLLASRQTELQGVTVSGNASSNEYIGEEKAKEIALNHAGASESNVQFTQVKLDYDDGYMMYEVDFYIGNTEYDYEINALTGEIHEHERDDEYNGGTQSGNGGSANQAPDNQSYIGETGAKEIALGHAGLTEAEVTYISVKLDLDDGKAKYEVEFKKERMEYDYDIDAVTGNILEWDHDYED